MEIIFTTAIMIASAMIGILIVKYANLRDRMEYIEDFLDYIMQDGIKMTITHKEEE